MIRRGVPPLPTAPNPYQWARDLFWDPFQEMENFPTLETPATMMPPFEVKENRESFIFKADVPGIKESDLNVTLTGNRLLVTGKREAEKEESSPTYYAKERMFGSFTRAFTLPDGADGDHVRAELKDGVLTVVISKKPEHQPKRIEIKPEKVRA
jgi:HSP20 family protein